MRFGVWISPYGHVIELNSACHIRTIISHPAAFCLNSLDISITYEKHNEQIGKEGKAREELIRGVTKHGWIRVRLYRDYWSFTVDRLSDRVKSIIDQFLRNLLNKQYSINLSMIPYNVNILEVQHNLITKTTIHDATKTGSQEKLLLTGVFHMDEIYEEILIKNKQLLK